VYARINIVERIRISYFLTLSCGKQCSRFVFIKDCLPSFVKMVAFWAEINRNYSAILALIKFLYFFIISSLFPYFNLFMSIFIQSYVNIKLHVSTHELKLGRKHLWRPPQAILVSDWLISKKSSPLMFIDGSELNEQFL
jgi:hypothetical protein